MANSLTGDFEAVVQVSVRHINALLATLHQNGASENAPLKLLHSATVRLGDRRKRPGDDLVADFGEWVREYQLARGPMTLGDVQTHLTTTTPPGAARMLEDFFSRFGEAEIPPTPPATVRGTARVQLGSPTLSFPSGSSSEVTVHVFIRAHYAPDAGTDPLPEPVHGEVRATFEVRQVGSPSGRRLVIRPSAQDSKIQFIAASGTGLSAADVATLSAQVRKAVRESFTLLPVDLPLDFAFSDFKGLESGAGQALALPLQLSGAATPVGGIQSVNNLFIGPSGFAFAVSREFVMTVFQPTIDRLLQFTTQFTVSIFLLPDPTYHVSVTGVELRFNHGSIDLIVRAKATTGSFGYPDFNNIVIRQRVTLVMFLDTLFIPAPDDELTISGLSYGVGRVRSLVIAERNRALPPAQEALNRELRAARTRLNNALHSFDPSASASFRAGSSEDPASASSGAIAITPDGVIVRGDLSGTARAAPIVHIAETNQRQAFTALESWIPGGRIDRLTWSWVEYPGHIPTVWSGVEKSATDEHRFIMPKPPGVTELSSICLRIEGVQTLANGQVVSVAGGTTCHVADFGEILEAPAWWEPVTLPVWLPDSTADATVKDIVAAHVSVQADAPPTNGLAHNSLVHFADWQGDNPLAGLGQALAALPRRGVSLVVIVVLPAGAFESRRREVEAKLDSIGERVLVHVLPTEDHEGGWARTFAVSKTSSTYLINARREFVWRHEGPIAVDALTAALRKHLMPAPAPRARPLRLRVSPGDRAPDATFEDRGQGFALHRLRGRAVLLNFWQSWSEPCLKELRRLQQVHERSGGHGPFIVAFHGGKEGDVLDEIRRRQTLSFPLVHDADQVIARKYGVRCWPTTVSIDADGLVSHVQFGLSPDRTPSFDRKETGS
jgi:peroxiredoxin